MKASIVARVAVVAIGAAVLLLVAVPAVGAFRSAVASDPPGQPPALDDEAGRRELDRVHHAQFECIRDRIAAEVPEGATVFVPLDPAAPEPDLWHQRLMELAYPRATIVDEPVDGATWLTVAPDATGDGCTGVTLVVLGGS